METPTVVLIDRNHAVLELAERALADAGFNALVTNDPSEAFDLSGTLHIDLVVGSVDDLASFRTQLDSPQLLEVHDPGEEGSRGSLRRPYSLWELQNAVGLALGCPEEIRGEVGLERDSPA